MKGGFQPAEESVFRFLAVACGFQGRDGVSVPVQGDEVAGDVLVAVVFRDPFPQEAFLAGAPLDGQAKVEAGDRISEESGRLPGRGAGASVAAVPQDVPFQLELLYNACEVRRHGCLHWATAGVAQVGLEYPRPERGAIPSRALSEREAEARNLEEHLTKITVHNHGPLRVEGEIVLGDGEGKPFGLGGRTSVSLCRCGHSENKPFCDGSHKKAGFQSEVQARELPPQAPNPSAA